MIEQVILNYLNAEIGNCYMERPEKAEMPFVIIEKTGSGLSNGIHSATFTFKSVAPTLFEAAKLNDDVVNALLEIQNKTEISKSVLNSDYNYTNTQTKEYRYQAVFDFVY